MIDIYEAFDNVKYLSGEYLNMSDFPVHIRLNHLAIACYTCN